MEDPANQKVGPWTLFEFLDKGGNAKVWKTVCEGVDDLGAEIAKFVVIEMINGVPFVNGSYVVWAQGALETLHVFCLD
jgi:hypothetical protein